MPFPFLLDPVQRKLYAEGRSKFYESWESKLCPKMKEYAQTLRSYSLRISNNSIRNVSPRHPKLGPPIITDLEGEHRMAAV